MNKKQRKTDKFLEDLILDDIKNWRYQKPFFCRRFFPSSISVMTSEIVKYFDVEKERALEALEMLVKLGFLNPTHNVGFSYTLSTKSLSGDFTNES